MTPFKNPSGHSAGPGRMTLSEIAALSGKTVKTIRNRIRPPHDIERQRWWAQRLDLRHRAVGNGHGLLHAATNLVEQHLDEIRGKDRPLY